MISKINQVTQGDLPLDQGYNRLSYEYSGSMKYTINVELIHYTYIRDILRYT